METPMMKRKPGKTTSVSVKTSWSAAACRRKKGMAFMPAM